MAADEPHAQGSRAQPTEQMPSRSTSTSAALNLVSDIADSINGVLAGHLRERRDWSERITGYAGYGGPGWVRVMARVLMTRPEEEMNRPPELVRGWRSFFTVQVPQQPIIVTAGSHRHMVRSNGSGLIDIVLTSDLPTGWHHVSLQTEDHEHVDVPVNIVDPSVRVGLISDVDDTVMVTTLPRAALAAWNTFVLTENARRSVPGMAVLYERWANAHPGAPVIYLSTGAWNVAPTLTRFLGRHLFPRGPLLLTDWGPTRERWFRSGTAHKRAQLRRLAREFPQIRWLLVGDDGQHDPDIYSEFAQAHPDHVAGVAIRHLSPTQQVLASGLQLPMEQARDVPGTPWVSAAHGSGLATKLVAAGLMQPDHLASQPQQPWPDHEDE